MIVDVPFQYAIKVKLKGSPGACRRRAEDSTQIAFAEALAADFPLVARAEPLDPGSPPFEWRKLGDRFYAPTGKPDIAALVRYGWSDCPGNGGSPRAFSVPASAAGENKHGIVRPGDPTIRRILASDRDERSADFHLRAAELGVADDRTACKLTVEPHYDVALTDGVRRWSGVASEEKLNWSAAFPATHYDAACAEATRQNKDNRAPRTEILDPSAFKIDAETVVRRSALACAFHLRFSIDGDGRDADLKSPAENGSVSELYAFAPELSTSPDRRHLTEVRALAEVLDRWEAEAFGPQPDADIFRGLAP
jgi:hypothetical protein